MWITTVTNILHRKVYGVTHYHKLTLTNMIEQIQLNHELHNYD
jgi:hypothetical protein